MAPTAAARTAAAARWPAPRALFFAVSGFLGGGSPGLGIVTLVLSPLVGLLYLCFFRMGCEFYLAITRMSEDINRRLPGR